MLLRLCSAWDAGGGGVYGVKCHQSAGGKESQKMKFHILIVRDGNMEFVEVDGQLVDVGYDIKAFVTNWTFSNHRYAIWRVVDLITGARLSRFCDSKREAVKYGKRTVKDNIEEYGNKQAEFTALYGSPPSGNEMTSS